MHAPKWPEDVGSPIELNYGPIIDNRMYMVNMKNLDLKIKWSWVQISASIHKLVEFCLNFLYNMK